MATASVVKPSAVSAKPSNCDINPEMVGHKVLEALGLPPGFKSVRARLVYDCNFRVNVFAEQAGGGIIPNNVITDSFFVTISDGEIISSSPVLDRKYQKDTAKS